jgi:hypothetical protein
MSKRRWEQIGAAGGIVFILLQLVSQGLIQVGGSEPAFSAPGDPAWMSLVAFGSALAGSAVALASSGWGAAVFRIGEGLDPELARYLFDDGNFGFATFWVFLAGFLLTASIVTLRDGALPRWIGWLGLVGALALLAGRAFWDLDSGVIFLPYLLAWIWILAASIVLIRDAGKTVP